MSPTDASAGRPNSLRERTKLAAMRDVQDVAFELFIDRGYDKVTVAQIADEAGTAPATVYRYFGSKAGIVYWHEYMDVLIDTVRARLDRMPPMQAVCSGLVDSIGRGFDDGRQLSRIQVMYATPELISAAATMAWGLMDELAAAIVDAHPDCSALKASAMASVAGTLADLALNEWQRSDAQRPLAELIEESFALGASLFEQKAD